MLTGEQTTQTGASPPASDPQFVELKTAEVGTEFTGAEGVAGHNSTDGCFLPRQPTLNKYTFILYPLFTAYHQLIILYSYVWIFEERKAFYKMTD